MPPADASRPSAASLLRSDASLGIRLSAAPSAPQAARRAVSERYRGTVSAGALEDAVLVVSELVTYAVLHGTGDIEVHVSFDGETVTGEVTDAGLRIGTQLRRLGAAHRDEAALFLLGRVTKSWGLRDGSGRVWFDILDRDGR